MVKRKRTPKKTEESSVEKKNKSKNNEVTMARNKYAGTLQEMLGRNESEPVRIRVTSSRRTSSRTPTPAKSKSLSSNCTPRKLVVVTPPVKRRKISSAKRPKVTTSVLNSPDTTPPPSESLQSLHPTWIPFHREGKFVIKFSGRSVDLTPFMNRPVLYPMVRAWIQNKLFFKNDNIYTHDTEMLRNQSILHLDWPSFDKTEFECLSDNDFESSGNGSESDEIEELINDPNHSKSGGKNIIFPLPDSLPEGCHTIRIPSPIPRSLKGVNLDYDYEKNPPPSKEDLLKEHLAQWSEVRKKWRLAGMKNEERYAKSKEILTSLFDKTQIFV